MAARTPRRSFATPFVVTLAAAPACYVQSSSPPPQSPPPSQPETAPAPAPAPGPGPVVVNPPRPTSPPPTTTPPQKPTAPPTTNPSPTQPTTQQSVAKWTIFKNKDGCMAAIKVECQPKATCNPPPPFKYACPENVSLDAPLTVASYDGGATCAIEYAAPKCPPNVMCNPPPPRKVTCPKR